MVVFNRNLFFQGSIFRGYVYTEIHTGYQVIVKLLLPKVGFLQTPSRLWLPNGRNGWCFHGVRQRPLAPAPWPPLLGKDFFDIIGWDFWRHLDNKGMDGRDAEIRNPVFIKRFESKTWKQKLMKNHFWLLSQEDSTFQKHIRLYFHYHKK